MIKQYTTYHKDTYEIKEYIEYYNDKVITHKRYDKLGRIIYNKTFCFTNQISEVLTKYHNDTIIKKHSIIKYNGIQERIFKFDKLSRCIYDKSNKHEFTWKYHKDTRNPILLTDGTYWEKSRYNEQGGLIKHWNSNGDGWINKLNKKTGNLEQHAFDKNGWTKTSIMVYKQGTAPYTL